jgi:hypothetical protein
MEDSDGVNSDADEDDEVRSVEAYHLMGGLVVREVAAPHADLDSRAPTLLVSSITLGTSMQRRSWQQLCLTVEAFGSLAVAKVRRESLGCCVHRQVPLSVV